MTTPILTEVPKVCPGCGGDDEIGTIEHITGWCHHYQGDPQGYTEVNWDSAKSVGVSCTNCGYYAELEIS